MHIFVQKENCVALSNISRNVTTHKMLRIFTRTEQTSVSTVSLFLLLRFGGKMAFLALIRQEMAKSARTYGKLFVAFVEV